MLASSCGSFLAVPTLPHFALPTGYAVRRVFPSAQSVGLIGFTLHLPIEFFEPDSIRRTTAHVASAFGTKRPADPTKYQNSPEKRIFLIAQ